MSIDRREADRRQGRPRVDDLRTGERVYVERRTGDDRRQSFEDATGTVACPVCEEYDEAESGGTACGLPECYRGRIGGWRESFPPDCDYDKWDGDRPIYRPVRCSPEQVRAVDAWLGRLPEKAADRRARLRRWLRA